ncbi:ComEC/Rec2 family competence protein [Candidatus Haliotispira prima]|uniref:ComEC/Rec2 family competence protein n=1 Tax=Candidatus Haliotispira prima TaxID=3034016 RepID=A0ABY8MI53_9SPIO|nr:ComEC/Rec2 family competence protein [Candidatus Haliotispira prima]
MAKILLLFCMEGNLCHLPRAKTALACYVCFYLTAYYLEPLLQPYLFLMLWVFGAGLLFLLCSVVLLAMKFRLIREQSIRFGSYAACIVLAIFAGLSLRHFAEQQLSHNSFGMNPAQVRIYFGRVDRDAFPAARDDSFLFTLKLLATSDGRYLLTSAKGRVLVRAGRPNPMPGLGQLVAVEASIKDVEVSETGKGQKKNRSRRDIPFSRAAPETIELFRTEEPEQAKHLPDLESPVNLVTSNPVTSDPVTSNPFTSKAIARTGGITGGMDRDPLIPLTNKTGKADKAGGITQQYLIQLIPPWQMFWQKLWHQRSAMRQTLFGSLRSLFPAAGRDLFLALLFGQSDELPERVKEHFRLSGSIHLLALSGFHVGILAAIVSFLLRRALGLRPSLLCGSAILSLYLWLVGPLPSLIRAVLMFLLFNGCKFFLRNGDGFSILALSALLQTGFFPAAALSLSFQLSYAALLGLILFAGRCNTLALLAHYRLCCLCRSRSIWALVFWPFAHLSGKRRHTRNLGFNFSFSFGFNFRFRCGQSLRLCGSVLLKLCSGLLKFLSRFLLQGMAVTVAVLLCSAPILIANFGRIYWVGLPASLVETPLITLYMWISLLLWPLAGLLQSYGQETLLAMMQEGYRYLYRFTLAPMEFFAQAQPWSFYRDETLLVSQLLLYLLLSGAILVLLYRYELRRLLKYLEPAGLRFRALRKNPFPRYRL